MCWVPFSVGGRLLNDVAVYFDTCPQHSERHTRLLYFHSYIMSDASRSQIKLLSKRENGMFFS